MTERRLDFRSRYGPWAVVAGASEGLGAAFATQLAERELNVLLVARRAERLRELAAEIERTHGVETRALAVDLADDGACAAIGEAAAGLEVGLLVYNAALSVVGPFFAAPLERHLAELDVNCRRPLELAYRLGAPMCERGRGGIVLMASLAGAQGSPRIAHYGATKAWNRVLAEGLWGELREHGVDVMACCAGATRTPRYLADRPGDRRSPVPEMEPEDVAREALSELGHTPSMIPGRVNRVVSQLMQRLLPRRTAIELMGRASRSVGVE
ncbi:MAG: SDR family NAD(P)-dependent oxidoreductase [Myxococcota bacterium]|nr:SDR family NAD(P)-dependent oxidoreductase [Myxococcota bacterium]